MCIDNLPHVTLSCDSSFNISNASYPGYIKVNDNWIKCLWTLESRENNLCEQKCKDCNMRTPNYGFPYCNKCHVKRRQERLEFKEEKMKEEMSWEVVKTIKKTLRIN